MSDDQMNGAYPDHKYPYGMTPDPSRQSFSEAGAALHRRVFGTEPPNPETIAQDVEPAEFGTPAGEPVFIEGKDFRDGTYYDLRDIIARGERLEIEAKRKLLRFAGLHNHDIAPEAIQLRWKLEVDATGWPRPQHLADLAADVARDLDEEQAAMRAVCEADPELTEAAIERMCNELTPDPELVRLLEEAEASWQAAISRAADTFQRLFPFYSPAIRQALQDEAKP